MRIFCLIPLATLGACATVVPQPAQPACALTDFPDNPHIAAWSVDKFAGRYRSGSDILYVTREGEHRFIIQRAGYGTRELATDNVEAWKFNDGCGLVYQFMLPPDGPGGRLTITEPGGLATEWNRG